MSYNPQSGRTFEDIVEGMLKFMGFNTKAHHTLQTRQSHIRAEIPHSKGIIKLHVECKHHEPVSMHDVECFCAKIAHAREKMEIDEGLLISNTSFSPETLSWCEMNCSFVKLRTYSQLISFCSRCKKLLSKFSIN